MKLSLLPLCPFSFYDTLNVRYSVDTCKTAIHAHPACCLQKSCYGRNYL